MKLPAFFERYNCLNHNQLHYHFNLHHSDLIPRPLALHQRTNSTHLAFFEAAALDEKIRSQLLVVDSIHHALKDAESYYLSLKEERNRRLDQINNLVHEGAILPHVQLPAEIITEICSYLDPFHFDTVYNVWGDIAFQTLPQTFSFYQLPKDEVQSILPKLASIRVENWFYGQESLDYFIPILCDLPAAGRWKEWLVHTSHEVLPLVHEGILAHIRACRPHLSTVIELQVRLAAHDTPELGVEHRCDGCLDDIQAPACSDLSLPLRLLPCFRNLNSGRTLHLEVDIRDCLSHDFSWYFRSFNIENLRTLTLIWDEPYPPPEPSSKFAAPNLQNISTYIMGSVISGAVFFTLLDCLERTHLESLDVFDRITDSYLYVLPVTFIKEVGRRFEALTRLSLHFQVHLPFVLNLIGGLQVQDESHVLLPRFAYLSLPHPWEDFSQLETDLMGILDSRRKSDVSIDTVELEIPEILTVSPKQQIQIDRLGLLVKNLLVTHNHTRWTRMDVF